MKAKLDYLKETKLLIKDAIHSAGVVIPEDRPFREYAAFIRSITPKLQNKTVVPTTQSQIITPDEGYDGLYEVIVEGGELHSPDYIAVSPNCPSGIIIANVSATLEV